jgi:SHS2 domain-containing protein
LYEILQHTADVRLRVSAATIEDLFAEALRGLMDVIKAERIQAGNVHARVRVTAPDTTALLVDFLNEVLTRCHIERAIYPRVRFRSMTAAALEADLEGDHVAGFGEDVKAVTYHEADVRQENGNWSTALVLDV